MGLAVQFGIKQAVGLFDHFIEDHQGKEKTGQKSDARDPQGYPVAYFHYVPSLIM
ncbi:hypothetical protein BMS3Abin13_01757 [bacterium BMS3Abin13]|nr:hypothetical protein BMS3Abin13_01757 [bacterium BMS3Abin13]